MLLSPGGDIDRGSADPAETVLDDEERNRVKGVIINKLEAVINCGTGLRMLEK